MNYSNENYNLFEKNKSKYLKTYYFCFPLNN